VNSQEEARKAAAMSQEEFVRGWASGAWPVWLMARWSAGAGIPALSKHPAADKLAACKALGLPSGSPVTAIVYHDIRARYAG
jgi:hypothetical protein